MNLLQWVRRQDWWYTPAESPLTSEMNYHLEEEFSLKESGALRVQSWSVLSLRGRRASEDSSVCLLAQLCHLDFWLRPWEWGETEAWLSPALWLAGCDLCWQQEILAAWPLLRQWLRASWQPHHGTEGHWQERASSGAAVPSVTMLSGGGLADSGGIMGGTRSEQGC